MHSLFYIVESFVKCGLEAFFIYWVGSLSVVFSSGVSVTTCSLSFPLWHFVKEMWQKTSQHVSSEGRVWITGSVCNWMIRYPGGAILSGNLERLFYGELGVRKVYESIVNSQWPYSNSLIIRKRNCQWSTVLCFNFRCVLVSLYIS